MKVKKNKALNWKRLVSVLCCIVVFCTTYALILPAVTLSKDTYCGKEAHTHDAECYREHDKSKPLCGLEEGEASEGHVHDASCYQTQEVGRTLICGLEEDGEHVHSDDCYETQVETVLVCGKEEGSGATEGHVHNDDCYISETPICGKEEHEHSHECYSNKEDVEDPKDWEEAYKDITKEEDAKTRILTVAKNEVGYKENEANFTVDENDAEHYYTRYGHLYEDMYGDWNNYFTGYVLKYANVKMNFDKDISKWQNKTIDDQKEEGEEGNVVFFRDDEGELRSGIVTKVDDLTKDIRVIEGDVDGQVKEERIKKDKVIAYLSDEVTIEDEDTPLAGDGVEKEEQTITQTAKDAEETVEVTATYTEEANIPEDAEFKVTKLEDSENGNPRFDIGIYDENGTEIEPEASVTITMKFNDLNNVSEKTNIRHFKNNGEIETIQPNNSIDQEGTLTSVYTMDSFSVVELYADVYDATIKVGEQITLNFLKDYYQNNIFSFNPEGIVKYTKKTENGIPWLTLTGLKPGVVTITNEYIINRSGDKRIQSKIVQVIENKPEPGENELFINYDIAKTHDSYDESNNHYFPEPTIKEAEQYTDSLSNDISSYEVLSPDVFEYGFGNDNDYRRFMFQFEGWIVNNNEENVIPAGTILTKEQLSTYSVNRVINLTAKWNSKGRDGTVNFYVNRSLSDYQDYTFGGTTNYGSDKFLPSSIYSASVSTLNGKTDYNSGNVYAAYNSQANDWRSSPEEVNNKIRGLTEKTQLSENKSNGTDTREFQLSSFPSDEVAMAEIRKQQADPNVPNDKKVKDEYGDTVEADTITPSNYTIHWYVFKMQNQCWHIDGCLVRKEASLTIKKTFAGNEAAIKAAKEKFEINVNLKTIGNEKKIKKTLLLTGDYNNDLNATETQSTGPLKYDESTNTYTWVIPLKTNREYEISEHNYIVDPELNAFIENERMATVAQYAITNSQKPTDGRKVYANNGRITITAESYTKNTDYNDFQTVNFFNTYIPSSQLLISKYGDYGLPLSNVEFQLFRQDSEEPMDIYLNEEGIYNIYGGSGSETLTNSFKTDKNGFVYIKGLKDEQMKGTYILREVNSLEGYNKIDDIYLDVDASGNITLSSSQNQDFVQMEGNVLEIKNTSQTTNLTVTKEWAEGATKEKVGVMLTRNGVPIQGTERWLGENGNWTTTWKNIPLYVGGNRANYSVREIWIGDTSYDETADNDGYTNYNVTISQTIQSNEGYQVVVRNSIATHGLSFTKTGELGGFKVLAGAKFRLSRNQDIPENQPYRDAISDNNGIVNFGVLSAGTYYMKEIEAPQGYECSNQVYKVEISGYRTTITKIDDLNNTPIESIPNYLVSVSLVINKVDNNGDALAEAEFTLSKKDDPTFTDVVKKSDSSGKIEFEGLKSGSYILKETKAPAGYNLLSTTYEFDVNEGQIKFTDNIPKEYENGVLKVVNDSGQALPNTGGAGTKLFTFSGAAVIAASGLMYGYKKKKDKRNGKGGLRK